MAAVNSSPAVWPRWHPARAAEDQTATYTIRPDQPVGNIAPDFMGLGYEISSVARPGLLSERNSVYVQLVRTLGPRGVIRIGGSTSDYAPLAGPDAAVKTDWVTRFAAAKHRSQNGRIVPPSP